MMMQESTNQLHWTFCSRLLGRRETHLGQTVQLVDLPIFLPSKTALSAVLLLVEKAAKLSFLSNWTGMGRIIILSDLPLPRLIKSALPLFALQVHLHVYLHQLSTKRN